MSFASHVRTFNDQPIPPGSRLVGYAAIAAAMGYRRPVRLPHVTFDNNTRTNRIDCYMVVGVRKAPADFLLSHLDYALRNEALNLAVLRLLFEDVSARDLASYVAEAPLSLSRRRLWATYEWMTSRKLPLPDLKTGNYIDLLDERDYHTREGDLERRQRVRMNLLGTPELSPIIRRTEANSPQRSSDIAAAVRSSCEGIEKTLLRRAASSLILGETRTTFAIEREDPPRDRLERWAQVIAQAGRRGPITEKEISRPQALILPDGNNMKLGWRDTQNFIGSFNRSYEAAPERINPKPDDLPRLMSGWMALVQDSQRIDPVVAAAVVSFSFVYLHPLEDGNGRLHRYLLHHILAERDFTPRGIVFPLSMPMLEKEEVYRSVLHSFDEEVMPFTDWRPNDAGGVEVLNETADLFRYMDLTEETDFVFDCVENAALQRLPEEISAIRKADDAMERLSRMVDLPEKRLRHFIMLVLQNRDRNSTFDLPNKRRRGDFADLDDEVVEEMVAVIREIQDDGPDAKAQDDISMKL